MIGKRGEVVEGDRPLPGVGFLMQREDFTNSGFHEGAFHILPLIENPVKQKLFKKPQ